MGTDVHRGSSQDFTAKDFRTWAGTVATRVLLRELEPFESATQARKNLVGVIKDFASQLGNTPSVCRKCYVHPAIVEAYLSRTPISGLNGAAKRRDYVKLRAAERAVLKFLRMGRANKTSTKTLEKS